MTRPTHKIAVIAGDGIGTEVMPEGIRVLKAAAEVFDLDLVFNEFEFGSCDYYQKHGKMMPDDWREQIEPHDAIFFGAVGWPDTVPDHISLWGSLIMFRRDFDQYVNLRPAKLMPGVPSPLAGRKPGDIDFYVVRENTEGEYSSVPDRFDVVVASNLFGDILSDLGPACTGTIGIAPSGNINPERKFPSLFEPVHGSAPDIAGKGIANPIGQIWSGAMMLDHLGHTDAHDAIMKAIETVLLDENLRTADLGGKANTVTCGEAIAKALRDNA